MVCVELLEIELVFEESDDGAFFQLVAKRDVDGCELFAGDTQLYDHLVGDGNCSEIEFFNIWGQIADLVDQVVGDVVLVLQIEVF
jgi:hypothetical protein